MESIEFRDYVSDYSKIQVRISKQGYYDIDAVEKNFNSVLKRLGDLDKTDHVAFLTLRLKNKVLVKQTVCDEETFVYVDPDYPVCFSIASALSRKISRKFWGRKSRYELMPIVFSIEQGGGGFDEHLHAIIRFKDLKEYYSADDIEQYLRETCHDLEEVNSIKSDPKAVVIRMFHYWEDQTKQLGHSIEYLCKTSSNHKDHSYNPLVFF